MRRSSDDGRILYAVTPDVLASVYRRAAEIATVLPVWTHGEWSNCLHTAALQHGVDPRKAATLAAEPVAQFMLTVPDGPVTRETAVASFRFVAGAIDAS